MCLALAIAASMPLADAPATDRSAVPVEARTQLERRFDRLDRDKNGFITPNEAPRSAQARCGADGHSAAKVDWMSSHDSDGDKQVSAREFVERSLASVTMAAKRR